MSHSDSSESERRAAQVIDWRSAWRMARRDLHIRFRGLRLLIICLFLGAMALTAIGTLSASIDHALKSRGQELLGGDIQLSLWQREANNDELKAMAEFGRVSSGVRLQAMAQAGEDAAPVALKSVDDSWPLYGEAIIADQTGERAAKRAPQPGEAWLAQGAMDRLGLSLGDRFKIGSEELRAVAIIESEPDQVGEGFQLGPTVIVAPDMPAKAGLLQPGSMFRSKYRIALNPGVNQNSAARDLKNALGEDGFELRTSERPSPGTDRFLTRMTDFLILVGLAALGIAGIGMGGGVTSYLSARRPAIATLKTLGASSRDIARIYGLQIGAAAVLGSLSGIAAGVALTPLLAIALENILPTGSGVVFSWQAALTALAFSLMVAMIFAATPLIRAREVPAMALMRSQVSAARPSRSAWGWIAAGLIGIVALILATASKPMLAAAFIGGSAATFLVLAGIGRLVTLLAKRLPRPRNPIIRQGLANLYRPGNATAALFTALGFGLTAFVLLAGVQSAVDGNIASRVPERAPNYFVLDLPKDGVKRFETTVRDIAPDAEIQAVPALRGTVLAYGPKDNMTRVADLKELPEGAWALRGERGLSYSATPPPDSTITEGEWWPQDYQGEPLVSIGADLAEATGLEIGDYITIGVLGVERTARIASFREVNWENMRLNYVLVFSPNTLEDAPHNFAATIALDDNSDQRGLLRALVKEFPASSVIEVGALLEQAQAVFAQISLATLASASVAVLAGLAVLLGAIAAARAARSYDAVILRVLGASRRQILAMQLAEYSLLALALAVIALPLGTGLAWLVVTQLFSFDWLPNWGVILGVLAGGAALIIGFALIASLPVLRSRPSEALRAL